jgi:hypothetical protein
VLQEPVQPNGEYIYSSVSNLLSFDDGMALKGGKDAKMIKT